MTIEELRALMATHFESYRAQHRERVEASGPYKEIELETHERLVDLYDGGRLKADWNEIAFENYVAEKQVPIERGTAHYTTLMAEHAERSIAHRRYIIDHDRALKSDSATAASTIPKPPTRPTAASSVSLRTLVKEFCSYNVKQELWNESTARERERHFDLLLDVMGTDRLAGDINADDARRTRDLLLDMPSNRNKKRETKELSVEQQAEIATAPKMQARTVKKYVETYQAMFAWAAMEKRIATNPFDGITVVVSAKALEGRERLPFDEDQLAVMIRTLRNGEHKDYQRWGTLIGIFTGARLNEICQLELKDVRQEDGIWCFDLNDDGEGKSLKSGAARRQVPVHSFLIESGLLTFVENMRQAGSERLFTELKYDPKNKWGRSLSRWFNDRFLPQLGMKTSQLAFHSLRHTMVSRLLNAGVEEAVVKAVVGHKAQGVTQATYNRLGYSLAKKKADIERFTAPITQTDS